MFIKLKSLTFYVKYVIIQIRKNRKGSIVMKTNETYFLTNSKGIHRDISKQHLNYISMMFTLKLLVFTVQTSEEKKQEILKLFK